MKSRSFTPQYIPTGPISVKKASSKSKGIIIKMVISESATAPMTVSPPDLATACWVFMKTQTGIKNDISITMFLQI